MGTLSSILYECADMHACMHHCPQVKFRCQYQMHASLPLHALATHVCQCGRGSSMDQEVHTCVETRAWGKRRGANVDNLLTKMAA